MDGYVGRFVHVDGQVTRNFVALLLNPIAVLPSIFFTLSSLILAYYGVERVGFRRLQLTEEDIQPAMLPWSSFTLLGWFLLRVVVASNQFSIPYWTTATTDNPKGRLTWVLGSNQTVSFTTDWDEFRVELWQAWPALDGATLASALVANREWGSREET